MRKTYTFDYVDEDDNVFVVTYEYYPGTETVMYKRNGDPGEPGDPAEIEVLKVTKDGKDVTGEVSAVLWDKIMNAAWEEEREDGSW